jgi:hypothetical protein
VFISKIYHPQVSKQDGSCVFWPPKDQLSPREMITSILKALEKPDLECSNESKWIEKDIGFEMINDWTYFVEVAQQ